MILTEYDERTQTVLLENALLNLVKLLEGQSLRHRQHQLQDLLCAGIVAPVQIQGEKAGLWLSEHYIELGFA